MEGPLEIFGFRPPKLPGFRPPKLPGFELRELFRSAWGIARNIEMPALLVRERLSRHVEGHEFVYSIIGLIGGFCCIFAGVGLLIMGVTGSVTWVVDLLGARSELHRAAPGVVLMVVGLFVIGITRFKPKVKKSIRKRKDDEHGASPQQPSDLGGT